MKPLRLLVTALLACTCTASAVIACDQDKSAASTTSATTASATKAGDKAHGACPAMAGCPAGSAQCTAAMRAACQKNAAVAAAMGCSAKGAAAAVVASNDKGVCSAHGTSASTAGSGYACSAHGTAASVTAMAAGSGQGCAAHGTAATTAAMTAGGKCDAKGAAAAKEAGCPMHGGAATASVEHCAGAKGASAVSAAAGMVCASHMSGVAHECSACEVWADCDQAIQKLGAHTQVVSLKNGAMIVYTADSNAQVKALQALVSKRSDKMMAALSAGNEKKLCDECRQLRGEMASGTLHREVVNVERGCMTLLTSNEPSVVRKIRNMTGQAVALR